MTAGASDFATGFGVVGGPIVAASYNAVAARGLPFHFCEWNEP
jgi:hypothetical protein